MRQGPVEHVLAWPGHPCGACWCWQEGRAGQGSGRSMAGGRARTVAAAAGEARQAHARKEAAHRVLGGGGLRAGRVGVGWGGAVREWGRRSRRRSRCNEKAEGGYEAEARRTRVSSMPEMWGVLHGRVPHAESPALSRDLMNLIPPPARPLPAQRIGARHPPVPSDPTARGPRHPPPSTHTQTQTNNRRRAPCPPCAARCSSARAQCPWTGSCSCGTCGSTPGAVP